MGLYILHFLCELVGTACGKQKTSFDVFLIDNLAWTTHTHKKKSATVFLTVYGTHHCMWFIKQLCSVLTDVMLHLCLAIRVGPTRLVRNSDWSHRTSTALQSWQLGKLMARGTWVQYSRAHQQLCSLQRFLWFPLSVIQMICRGFVKWSHQPASGVKFEAYLFNAVYFVPKSIFPL